MITQCIVTLLSGADYFHRFYHLERELPTNYDLVVNTDVLTVEQAQAAVLAIALA